MQPVWLGKRYRTSGHTCTVSPSRVAVWLNATQQTPLHAARTLRPRLAKVEDMLSADTDNQRDPVKWVLASPRRLARGRVGEQGRGAGAGRKGPEGAAEGTCHGFVFLASTRPTHPMRPWQASAITQPPSNIECGHVRAVAGTVPQQQGRAWVAAAAARVCCIPAARTGGATPAPHRWTLRAPWQSAASRCRLRGSQVAAGGVRGRRRWRVACRSDRCVSRPRTPPYVASTCAVRRTLRCCFKKHKENVAQRQCMRCSKATVCCAVCAAYCFVANST